MLNKCTLQGRITKDIELRKTQNGVSVVQTSIACERDVKDANGNKPTDFIDIVLWRNSAEYIAKYGSKGRMILVSGRLQMRDYKDANGNRKRASEIIADDIYFLDRVNNADAQESAPVFVPIEDDGDLPF